MFKCKCRNVSVQVQVWKCQCVSVSVEVSVFKRFSGRTLRNAFGKKTTSKMHTPTDKHGKLTPHSPHYQSRWGRFIKSAAARMGFWVGALELSQKLCFLLFKRKNQKGLEHWRALVCSLSCTWKFWLRCELSTSDMSQPSGNSSTPLLWTALVNNIENETAKTPVRRHHLY